MSFSRVQSDPAAVPAHWDRGVRNRIYEHVFSDLRHEVGGFLIGHRDTGGRIAIRDCVPALAADGRTASITFTQQAWADVHDELDSHYPDEQIIGWYHSHPGFGIFLSDHDLFIHRNFFSDSAQMAYVVDPHAGREGIFGWRDGDVALLCERATERRAQRPRPPSQTATRGRGGRARVYVLAVLVGAIIGLAAALILTSGGASRATRAGHRAPAVGRRAGRARGRDTAPTGRPSRLVPPAGLEGQRPRSAATAPPRAPLGATESNGAATGRSGVTVDGGAAAPGAGPSTRSGAAPPNAQRPAGNAPSGGGMR